MVATQVVPHLAERRRRRPGSGPGGAERHRPRRTHRPRGVAAVGRDGRRDLWRRAVAHRRDPAPSCSPPTRRTRLRRPCSPRSFRIPPATAGSCGRPTVPSPGSSSIATPRPSSGRSREINSGIYAFDATALTDALARVKTDNIQGEEYLTDVARHPARRGPPGVGVRGVRTTPRSSASTTACSSPSCAGSSTTGSSARWMLAGRHGRRPRHDLGRCDRDSRARRHAAPAHAALGATTVGAGARDRARDDAHRHRRRAGRPGRPHTQPGRGDRRWRERRAVRLPSARHEARRQGQDRHVRRDEERRHRTGREGAAPDLRRRRHHRRGQPTSAPARSSPTTTECTNTTPTSGGTRSSAATRSWSRPVGSPTAPTSLPGRPSSRTSIRASSRWREASNATSPAGWRASGPGPRPRRRLPRRRKRPGQVATVGESAPRQARLAVARTPPGGAVE